MAIGKKLAKAREGIDREHLYTLTEAVKMVKERVSAKFDETIEIAMNLGVDPRHADILQHGQVLDVFIAEGHPETRAFHLGVELGEAFELLVIHHVHVLRADRLEVEFDLLAHCMDVRRT